MSFFVLRVEAMLPGFGVGLGNVGGCCVVGPVHQRVLAEHGRHFVV